ncbi:hypothetical protein NEUTE2DRAFT_129548 [Neurospora tetrasperma FGSC 2509]|nr:hypothetical protein NEUTE2DRAFT_129548 [Neurospora tetrasperma FGSC 2509]
MNKCSCDQFLPYSRLHTELGWLTGALERSMVKRTWDRNNQNTDKVQQIKWKGNTIGCLCPVRFPLPAPEPLGTLTTCCPTAVVGADCQADGLLTAGDRLKDYLDIATFLL